MCDNKERITGADSATILADFRRRFRDEFRGIGIDRIRVVLPGSEPGTYRVVVCEDADEAAACLRGASDDRRGCLVFARRIQLLGVAEPDARNDTGHVASNDGTRAVWTPSCRLWRQTVGTAAGLPASTGTTARPAPSTG